jgi:hypothetical protein
MSGDRIDQRDVPIRILGTDGSLQLFAIGRNENVRWPTAHLVLLSHRMRAFGVYLHRNVIRVNGTHDVRASEDLAVDDATRRTIVRPEMEQDESVLVSGHLSRFIDVRLPADLGVGRVSAHD